MRRDTPFPIWWSSSRSSATAPKRPRDGFTIVELVVAIGVIAVLLSILLPAVQQARAAARRTQCRNQLRQLGLAIQNYESAHSVLPPGRVLGGWSFKTMLMPQLDFAADYSQIDFANDIESPPGMYSCGPESMRLGALKAAPDGRLRPFFYCPSDPLAGGPVVPCGNYVGVGGDFMMPGVIEYFPGDPLPPAGTGLLFLCSNIRMSDTRDGAANTLCVGERGVSEDRTTSPDFCNYSDRDSWLAVTAGLHPQGWASDHRVRFWSHHPGGAHFLFADGHVQLLSYSIAQSTLMSLSTRNSSDVPGEY